MRKIILSVAIICCAACFAFAADNNAETENAAQDNQAQTVVEKKPVNLVGNGNFLQGQYRWNLQIEGKLEAKFEDEQLVVKRLEKGYARIFQDISLTPGKYNFSYTHRMFSSPKTVVHVWLILKNDQNKYDEKNYIYLSSYYSDGKLKEASKKIDIPQHIIGARLCITVDGEKGAAVIDDIKLEKQN